MNPLHTVQPSQLQLGPSLGGGGFADVRRALIHLENGQRRRVAVKILRDHRAHNPEELREFQAEILLSRQLDHPNIAKTYCDLLLEGRQAMVMELVEGVSVHALLAFLKQRRENLTVEACALLISQAAHGMHYAWEGRDAEGRPFEIVHRDLKPANLMLTKQAELKVLDFGVAKAKQRASVTKTGFVKGTLLYLSPEQAEGRRDLTHASDQFALGTILYELLALRPLYPAEAPAIALGRILQADIGQALVQLRAEAQVIRPVLERMLARHPSERFPSHQAVADALAKLLEHPETVETAKLELISVVARARHQLRPVGSKRRTDAASVTTIQLQPGAVHSILPTERLTAPAVAKRPPVENLLALETQETAPARPRPKSSRASLVVAARLLSACLTLLVSLPEMQLLSEPLHRVETSAAISGASRQPKWVPAVVRVATASSREADLGTLRTRSTPVALEPPASKAGKGASPLEMKSTAGTRPSRVEQGSTSRKDTVSSVLPVKEGSSPAEHPQLVPPTEGLAAPTTPHPERDTAALEPALPSTLPLREVPPQADPALLARRLPVPVCFTSWPVLVELWVDDRVYLSEPGTLRLEPGLHRIRIRAQQHREQEFRVEIPATGPVKVHWRFDARRLDITEEACR